MFQNIIKSSKAAIDLASIMVGIIVIGLIGGVIAATVFAVIPWAQDNAAKNQADAVNVAQNAYNGLTVTGQTSGSITTPAGVVLAAAGNSYGTLKNLVDKGVFTIQLAPNSTTVSADGTICTTPTDSGKNYRTEVKSQSGKIFYTTADHTKPEVLTGASQCLPSEISAAPTETTTVDDVANQFSQWQTRVSALPGGNSTTTIVFPEFTVTSTSPTPVNWEFRLNRTVAPFSYINTADITTPVSLGDARLASKVDGNYIVIYNTDTSSQIKQGVSFTIGGSQKEISFRYTAPTYPSSAVTNSGFVNLEKNGNTVLGDLNVQLTDVNQKVFGAWSTTVDATNMSTLAGKTGVLTLASDKTAQGFSLVRNSGNSYTLSYAPTSNSSWVLKGKNVNFEPNGSPQGVLNLSRFFTFTADNTTTSVTLVAKGAPGTDPWSATQTFRIQTPVNGPWVSEVNLSQLRDVNRARNVKNNNGASFTLAPKQGDTTGNIYILTFSGSYTVTDDIVFQLTA